VGRCAQGEAAGRGAHLRLVNPSPRRARCCGETTPRSRERPGLRDWVVVRAASFWAAAPCTSMDPHRESVDSWLSRRPRTGRSREAAARTAREAGGRVVCERLLFTRIPDFFSTSASASSTVRCCRTDLQGLPMCVRGCTLATSSDGARPLATDCGASPSKIPQPELVKLQTVTILPNAYQVGLLPLFDPNSHSN